MKSAEFLFVAMPLVLLSVDGRRATNSSPTQPQQIAGVELPCDPLMAAIEQRFGRPDRVYGSGRAFFHYDLSNGDTFTAVVSGSQIVGSYHESKHQP